MGFNNCTGWPVQYYKICRFHFCKTHSLQLIFYCKPFMITAILLKALCHAIRADYLLMNPHAPTHQMKTGCGGRLIHCKFASHIQVHLLRLSLQRVQCFKHRMCSIAVTYQYSYPLAAHNWRLWACQLDYQQNLCTVHVRLLRTPMHYTVILGLPYFLYPP